MQNRIKNNIFLHKDRDDWGPIMKLAKIIK